MANRNSVLLKFLVNLNFKFEGKLKFIVVTYLQNKDIGAMTVSISTLIRIKFGHLA
jgi:hypothetical protein